MTTLSGPRALDKAGSPVRFAHSTGFWMIAAAFLITMAFSTVPTPLYPARRPNRQRHPPAEAAGAPLDAIHAANAAGAKEN